MKLCALPKGWVTAPLERVAEVQLGKMLDKAKNTGTLRPYLRNVNVRWAGFDLGDLASIRMSEAEAQKFCIRDGDVLVCEGGEPGRCAVWTGGKTELTYQKALHRVRVTAALNPWLLSWQLHLDALTGTLAQRFTGSTIKHLPQVALQKYEVLVPPAAEQLRIVDKLVTLLARVAACRDRLASVSPLLKRFRRSVLAAATSGRLTEDWRSKAGGGTASQGFRLGEDRVTCPSSWTVSNLSELIDPARPLCYGVVQPGVERPGGIRLVRVQDLDRASISLQSLRTISAEVEAEYKRSRIREGDLLISIVGTIGRTALVPEGFEGNIARAIARVATRQSANPRWIDAWLNSSPVQWWLASSSREVARKTLNLSELAALPVPLPSTEEQSEIVRRVETLFGYADRLEARLATAQIAVDRLTPSLLAKAFRGELVLQDPADEPAAELLQRLAAQRETAPTRTRRQRATA